MRLHIIIPDICSAVGLAKKIDIRMDKVMDKGIVLDNGHDHILWT